MRNRLTIWLLYASFIVFPFGNILRLDLGMGIALMPLDVVVGLIGLTSLPSFSSIRSDPLQRYAWIFVAIGTLSLGLSTVWSYPLHGLAALLYGVRFIAYVNLITVVRNLAPQARQKCLVALGWSGVAMLALGLAQYVLYPDLRNLYYLGWDEHLKRLFGTVLDPNFTGALFICFIAVLDKGRLLYTKYSKPIVIAMLVFAFSVVLTYSRGSLLMLLVSGLTYMLLRGAGRYGIPLLIAVVLSAGVLTMTQKGESVNLLRTASIHARIIEYQEVLRIIKENPLLGVGYNAYRYAQQKQGFLSEHTWETDHAGAGVPNSYLFVLATTGLIGFTAYGAFWLTLLRQLWIRKDSVFIALYVGLSVHALFDNSLFYPFIIYVLFILKGYSDGVKVGGSMREASEAHV